jgi:GT2 family glycosyltransferase
MQNGEYNQLEPPLISIIIPAYNVSNYIGEALRSIFIQDFESYEVIVVNDGSSDTPELEKVLEPYRGKIHYIYQENRGISAARNAALRVARGELVALLDADDVWLEGKLSEQVEFMKQAQFDLVYADALLIGDVPWPKGTTFMDRSPSEGPVTLNSLLGLRVTVVVSTVIMRKDLVQQVGGFDEEDRNITEDFDLWLRLARSGARMGYQRKILAEYRYRSDSISAGRITLHEAALNVLRKTRRGMTLSLSEEDALQRTEQRLQGILMLERSKTMIVKGEIEEARAMLAKARKTDSSWKVSLALVALRTFPGLLRRYIQKRYPSLSN